MFRVEVNPLFGSGSRCARCRIPRHASQFCAGEQREAALLAVGFPEAPGGVCMFCDPKCPALVIPHLKGKPEDRRRVSREARPGLQPADRGYLINRPRFFTGGVR